MPRSNLSKNSCYALVALVAFVALVSLMMIEAGAQTRRRASRFKIQQNLMTGTSPQQVRRKNIASLRSVETADGTRVTITSDVPLNDYAAYLSGDRYFVVIPDADLVTQNVQALQNSLRGRGFQDAKVVKHGQDVVLSFRLQPGMRARVEQKFNRIDVVFTGPLSIAGTGNTSQTGRGGQTPNDIISGNQQTNTSGGYSTGTGNTGAGATGTGATGTYASSGGSRGGRWGRGRGGYVYGGGGYGGGGGGGGGQPLVIPPLPSEIAQAEATPSPTPLGGEQLAQASPSPLSTSSPTPEQIAQAQQPPTVGQPPTTTTTTAPVQPVADPSFAAAIRNNWLPLLIGLLVLLAIGLLLVSRSRADRAETATQERVETKKRETLKDAPGTKAVTTLAGGAAAAGAAKAAAKDSRAVTAPTKPVEKKEESKGIEPVGPAVEVERISTEVKSLLEGGRYDDAIIGSANPETRQLVSTELLAALASRNPERRDRAREAFTKHGFFDEATRNLRTAEIPAERISAARALGLTQDRAATPHLVAALEDSDPEVRRAAVNSLAELRDPSAIGPLNALLEREKNRKVPHSLIRRAIESSATIDVAETGATTDTPVASAAVPTPAAAATDTTAAEKTDAAEKKDDDDQDREVFEI